MCPGAGGQGSTLFECLCFEGGDKAVSEVLGELAPRTKEKDGREQGPLPPLKEEGWLSAPWLVTAGHRKDLTEQEGLVLVGPKEESHRER